MEIFFLIITIFFIVSANVIGFLLYRKKKSLYSAAFTILLLALPFSGIGSVLAILIIRDGFAIFYGLKIGYYLMINSAIVFVIAISVTLVRNYRIKK